MKSREAGRAGSSRYNPGSDSNPAGGAANGVRGGRGRGARRPHPLGGFFAGAENYLVGPAIEGVLHQRVAAYNPLVLHGPSGTGKSHLARGMADAWTETSPQAAVVYTTAVDFARELADAIETQAVVDLRRRYRSAGLLVFEEAGRLADKPAAQAELIHTLDAILRKGGQVVVTASAQPTELRGLLPAVQSQAVGGLGGAAVGAGTAAQAEHPAEIGHAPRHPLERAGRPGAGRGAQGHGAGVAGGVGTIGRASPHGQ